MIHFLLNHYLCSIYFLTGLCTMFGAFFFSPLENDTEYDNFVVWCFVCGIFWPALILLGSGWMLVKLREKFQAWLMSCNHTWLIDEEAIAKPEVVSMKCTKCKKKEEICLKYT